MWIRTCNECGYRQEDNEPDHTKDLPISYMNRKCKKCNSEGLDYGFDGVEKQLKENS